MFLPECVQTWVIKAFVRQVTQKGIIRTIAFHFFLGVHSRADLHDPKECLEPLLLKFLKFS